MINYEDWKWYRDHRYDAVNLKGKAKEQFIDATLAWIIMALEPDGIVTQKPKQSEIDLK
jgi:hypothetical protein